MDKKSLPKKLLEQLEPGEEIIYATKKMPSLEKPKWLVVTDRRIIIFDEKILGRYEMRSIPYEKVEQINFVKGIASTEFTITMENGEKVELSWMKKQEGAKVMEAIREAIARIAVEPPAITRKKGLTREEMVLVKPKETIVRSVGQPYTGPVRQPEKKDPYEELLKLKKLRDEGVISEEEYERLRKKLLGKIG